MKYMGSIPVYLDPGFRVDFGVTISTDMRSFVDHQNAGAHIIGDALGQDTAEKTSADDKVVMFQFVCHTLCEWVDLFI
jgi:hypothetical protein